MGVNSESLWSKCHLPPYGKKAWFDKKLLLSNRDIIVKYEPVEDVWNESFRSTRGNIKNLSVLFNSLRMMSDNTQPMTLEKTIFSRLRSNSICVSPETREYTKRLASAIDTATTSNFYEDFECSIQESLGFISLTEALKKSDSDLLTIREIANSCDVNLDVLNSHADVSIEDIIDSSPKTHIEHICYLSDSNDELNRSVLRK